MVSTEVKNFAVAFLSGPSQSPWRVFWFPQTLGRGNFVRVRKSRNPLGGSFGFHKGKVRLQTGVLYKESQSPWRVFWFPPYETLARCCQSVRVAIPLAGLLVSTKEIQQEEPIEGMSQSPWRVFWFPQLKKEQKSMDLSLSSQSPWRVFWFPPFRQSR